MSEAERDETNAGDRIRSRVLNALRGEPWAILPEKLELLDQIVVDRLLHGKLVEERSEVLVVEAKGEPENAPLWRIQNVAGGRQIAVMPIHGVLSKRIGFFERMSGGMSSDAIADAARELERDDGVAGVVLDVDSPGGQVAGTEAAAAAVRSLAEKKPVYSVSNDGMFSGAYWIGSAARRVFLRESSGAGSVGVITMHFDRSKQLANYGIKPTIIAAGRHKAVGNEYQALDEESVKVIRDRIHSLYETFVANVAANRRLSVDHVRERIADGRVFTGRQAIDVGAADEIGGLEQAIAKLTGELSSSASSKGVILVGAEATPAASAIAATEAAKPADDNTATAVEPTKAAIAEPAKLDEAAIRQAAIADERKRADEIRALVATSGLDAKLADDFIANDCTVQATQSRLFELMRERNAASGVGANAKPVPTAPAAGTKEAVEAEARKEYAATRDVQEKLNVTEEQYVASAVKRAKLAA